MVELQLLGQSGVAGYGCFGLLHLEVAEGGCEAACAVKEVEKRWEGIRGVKKEFLLVGMSPVLLCESVAKVGVCWAFEKKVIDRLRVAVASGARGSVGSFDTVEVCIEWDMASAELN